MPEENRILKAQPAFEYIIIASIVVAFLVPIWLYMSSVQTRAKSQLSISYAKNMAEKITDTADSLWSQGPPAKVRIRVYVPDNVVNASLINTTVRIRLRIGRHLSDVSSISSAPLNGTLPTSEGNYWLSLEAKSSFVDISVSQ